MANKKQNTKSKKIKAEKLDQAKAAIDAQELAAEDEAESVVASEESAEAAAPKRKGGRRPMSEAEKAEAAKARAEAKAKEAGMTPELYLQFNGGEVDLAALVESAKADFKSTRKRTPLTELKLYIKPEDGAAYYVANGSVEGKVSF